MPTHHGLLWFLRCKDFVHPKYYAYIDICSTYPFGNKTSPLSIARALKSCHVPLTHCGWEKNFAQGWIILAGTPPTNRCQVDLVHPQCAPMIIGQQCHVHMLGLWYHQGSKTFFGNPQSTATNVFTGICNRYKTAISWVAVLFSRELGCTPSQTAIKTQVVSRKPSGRASAFSQIKTGEAFCPLSATRAKGRHETNIFHPLVFDPEFISFDACHLAPQMPSDHGKKSGILFRLVEFKREPR